MAFSWYHCWLSPCSGKCWRGPHLTSEETVHEGVSELFQNRTGCPERGESLSLEMARRGWQASCWEAEEGTAAAIGQG